MATDKPEEQKPSATATITSRLLDQAERDNERTEREHQRALESLTEQARLWQRTALALIVVLAVLVAGVVGVGVSGTLPGIGQITITQPTGNTEQPAPQEPEPEPASEPPAPALAPDATPDAEPELGAAEEGAVP